MVRALRNHPSLIAWCGGNEISPRRERLPLEALAAVLAEEDPARPWIPASPCDGDLHHWQVWHGFAPWTDLAGLDAPFMSEFGLQALPDCDDRDRDVPRRRAGFTGRPALGRAQGARSRSCATTPARMPALRRAQDPALLLPSRPRSASQAAALQVGIEACRLRRETADR